MKNEDNLQLQSIVRTINTNVQCDNLAIREDSQGLRGLYNTEARHIGDKILQIPYKSILTHLHFSSAYLCKYFKWLRKLSKNSNHPVLNWNILQIYPASQYLKQLASEESQYNIAPLIYFFQQRFCDDSSFYQTGNAQEIQDKWVKSYIEYLPHDYEFIPYHFSHIIKNYHPELGAQLQSFGQKLRFSYDFLKFLLEGRDLPQQFRFVSYLKRKTSDNEYFYQKYYQNFTFDSFQWAYFTWKTRVFDKGCQKCKSASGLFIPILDLINHDKQASNADWIFDDEHDLMKLLARKNIQIGDQILIDYGQRTLQMFFKDYGFIAQEQACQIKIEINKQINFSFFVNNYTSSEQAQIGLKEQIRIFVQKCNSISEIEGAQEKLSEQLKKKSSEKKEKIQQLHNLAQTKMYSAQQTHIIRQIEELLNIQMKAAQSILHFLNTRAK